jgi:hypothetical protein
MSNRSILKLIDLPTYRQISCPIVLCLPAANAEGDGPTLSSGLLVSFKGFGKGPDLVDLQKQSVTGIRFDCPPYAIGIGA